MEDSTLDLTSQQEVPRLNGASDFCSAPVFDNETEAGSFKPVTISLTAELNKLVYTEIHELNPSPLFWLSAHESSHGSNLDGPAVCTAMPQACGFIAKKELFKIPILGQCFLAVGNMPIDRQNLESAIATLKKAGERITKENRCISIAPEGTRRRSKSTSGPDQFLPFKKGPFHLAKSANVDILPIVLMGSNRLWEPGQVFPTQGTLYIKYLEPIPGDFVKSASMDDLQAKVRERFEQGVEKIDDKKIFTNPNKSYWMAGFFLLLDIIIVKLLFF